VFHHDDHPPLYVPDLTKPAGATVDADGNVTCVQCQAKVALSRADVVGQGYRCAPCSARAEISALSGGPSDVGANLSLSDRRGLSNAGAAMMVPGILMIIGGVILFGVLPGTRAPIYLLVGGIVSAGAGLAKMNAAK
jgi:hypothetical protein